MSLIVTPVNKTLDRKLKLLGYEVPDLLALFIILSVLNFLFGPGLKLLCVWAPTLTVAMILRIGKRGKPDNYLIHFFKYYLSPGVYSAFPSPSIDVPPPKRRKTI